MLLFYDNYIVFMDGLTFFCLFSYPSLLELHYGGRLRKSLTTKEWANTEGLSVREVEHHMDVEMFLEGQAG